MTYITTVPAGRADGAVAEMYASDTAAWGHLPNMTRAFSPRPGVYAAWRQLNGAIKQNMDLRRYELATIAAAVRLRSSYCALAHGSVLAEDFDGPDTVRAILTDRRSAGLDAIDLAVMDLAEKVAGDPTAITEDDFEPLRALGLGDEELLDIVLAAAARCFFSTALDALGAQPDHAFAALEPRLRDALTVGRPIAEA
jgi:uncharacterized peroxidase-related enzyme